MLGIGLEPLSLLSCNVCRFRVAVRVAVRVRVRVRVRITNTHAVTVTVHTHRRACVVFGLVPAAL